MDSPDVLQLCASDTEIIGLEKDRAIFPVDGMSCNVPKCDTPVYQTYSKFMKHWKLCHLSKLQKYKCMKCRRVFKTKPHAISCIKRHKHDENIPSNLIIIYVENLNFIDPKDVPPPRKGSQSERELPECFQQS